MDRTELQFIIRFRNEAEAAVRAATQSINSFGTATAQAAVQQEAFNQAQEEAKQALDRVRSDATKAIVSAAPIVLATRSFANFETGLVSVGKTTGTTGAELEQLGKSITDISLDIPVGTEELLNLATVAGQLGITGTADIIKFTETVSKLGVASDLAGEEAATTLARVLSITGEDIQSVDTFASVIVRLGNNAAASEREIAGATREVALAIARFDVGTTSASAYGAAMASLGIRASTGGTTLGRAFNAIEIAVQSGGKELDAFVELTGLTSQEFLRLANSSPEAAFDAFLQGLGASIENGENYLEVLERLGLSNSESLKVLTTLGVNYEELARFQGLANDEAERNAALNEEAATAFSTFSSQVTVAFNALKALNVELGERFVVIIGPAVQLIGAAARLLITLDEATGGAVTTLAALVVSLVAVNAVVRLALSVNVLFGTSLATIASSSLFASVTALPSYISSLTLTTAASGAATVASNAFGVALRFALGPIGLLIAAAGALAVALDAVETTSDEARAANEELYAVMDDATGVVADLTGLTFDQADARLADARNARAQLVAELELRQARLEGSRALSAYIALSNNPLPQAQGAAQAILLATNLDEDIRVYQDLEDAIDSANVAIQELERNTVSTFGSLDPIEAEAIARFDEYRAAQQRAAAETEAARQKQLEATREAREASAELVQNTEEEIANTIALAGALGMSQEAYELLAEKQSLLAEGFLGSDEQLTALARRTLEAEKQLELAEQQIQLDKDKVAEDEAKELAAKNITMNLQEQLITVQQRLDIESASTAEANRLALAYDVQNQARRDGVIVSQEQLELIERIAAEEERIRLARLEQNLNGDADEFLRDQADIRTLNASGAITDDEARLAEGNLGLSQDLASVEQDIGGEIARETELEILELHELEKAEILRSAREANLLTQTEYEDRLLALTVNSANQRRDAQLAAAQAETAAVTGSLDNILGAISEFGGKQSGLYRGILVARKAFATAEVIINTTRAVQNALADYPVPINFVVAAGQAAAGAANIAKINGANFAEGGLVTGPGTGTSDSIPANLSNGEFVLTAERTRQYRDIIQAIHEGTLGTSQATPQFFAEGGLVSSNGTPSLNVPNGGGGSSRMSITIAPTINFSGGDEETNRRQGAETIEQMRELIDERLVEQLRPNGLLNGAA